MQFAVDRVVSVRAAARPACLLAAPSRPTECRRRLVAAPAFQTEAGVPPPPPPPPPPPGQVRWASWRLPPFPTHLRGSPGAHTWPTVSRNAHNTTSNLMLHCAFPCADGLHWLDPQTTSRRGVLQRFGGLGASAAVGGVVGFLLGQRSGGSNDGQLSAAERAEVGGCSTMGLHNAAFCGRQGGCTGCGVRGVEHWTWGVGTRKTQRNLARRQATWGVGIGYGMGDGACRPR